jgi:hypothetical protein
MQQRACVGCPYAARGLPRMSHAAARAGAAAGKRWPPLGALRQCISRTLSTHAKPRSRDHLPQQPQRSRQCRGPPTCPRKGPHEPIQLVLPTLQHLRQPHIGDLGVALPREQDVLRQRRASAARHGSSCQRRAALAGTRAARASGAAAPWQAVRQHCCKLAVRCDSECSGSCSAALVQLQAPFSKPARRFCRQNVMGSAAPGQAGALATPP